MLSRDQILALPINKPRLISVDVPEWGGAVYVRAMTVKEQECFWEIMRDADKGVYAPAGKRGSTVLMAACNDDGSPLFTDADAEWLGSSANANAVQRIHVAIIEATDMTPEAMADIAKKPD